MSATQPEIDAQHRRRLEQAVFNADLDEIRAIAQEGRISPDSTLLGQGLIVAVRAGDLPTVKAVLRAGAYPNPMSARDGPATQVATDWGHHEVLAALLEAGASPNGAHGQEGPLARAVRWGHAKVVDALIRAGAAVDMAGPGGVNLLHTAVAHGHPHLIRPLLQAGLSAHSTDDCGSTALHYAASVARGPLSFGLLVEQGLDVNARNSAGITPAMWAATHGQIENFAALTELGADPLTQDDQGGSAVDWAMLGKHETMVLWLLDRHPSIAARGEGLDKTLVEAVRKGFTATVIKLVEMGADLGQRRDGKTLLQCVPRSNAEMKRLIRALKTGSKIESAMGDTEAAPAAATPSMTL